MRLGRMLVSKAKAYPASQTAEAKDEADSTGAARLPQWGRLRRMAVPASAVPSASAGYWWTTSRLQRPWCESSSGRCVWRSL
jgi:hypothetical protein